MINKLVLLYWYLKTGRFIQVQDGFDEMMLRAIKRHAITSIFSLLLLVFSIALFYFVVIRPFIRWTRSQFGNQISPEDQVKHDRNILIAIISDGFIWGIFILIGFFASHLNYNFKDRFHDFISQVVGPAPRAENLESCEPDPLEAPDECFLRKKNGRDFLMSQMIENPSNFLNEQKYRQLKSNLINVDCESKPPVESAKFTDCERALTESERYRLTVSLVNWTTLGFLLFALHFVIKKFRMRLRAWIEKKLIWKK